MDEQKREFLAQHYAAAQWLGRQSTGGSIRDFRLTGSEIPGWTLIRAQRKEGATSPDVHSMWHSMWRHGDAADEVVSVRVTECADAAAAQDQVLEELGNFQSPKIERRAGADAVGDVAFGLGQTMALFARGNLVAVILNAGPKAVSVAALARDLDTRIREQLA
jgi:hypothetical protein